MKKFLEEFKAFALKGNVMDMAIGVMVGGAFQSIITALTENILNPIIGCLGGTEIGLATPIGNTGQVINWGAFITAVINFLIMAFVLFCILKAVNKIMPKKEEAPAAPAKSDETKVLEEILTAIKEKN